MLAATSRERARNSSFAVALLKILFEATGKSLTCLSLDPRPLCLVHQGHTMPGAMNPAVDTSSERTPSQLPRRLRILVADDERDTVLTLMELLREEGHETRSVYKGTDVMTAMEAFDPDAVLLDISMPGMSGWEVARAIRAAHGDKRPLLIAISGVYKLAADQILGLLAGFNYNLAKPYDPGVLLTLLSRAE